MRKLFALLLSLCMILSAAALFAVQAHADEDNGEDGAGEELPSSFTLVGSPDLPPIGNQGEVGCCASMAITYMQFTNAVSKYIRANCPEKKFEPATGRPEYIFAPKWTYTLSGSGTAWVYDILVQTGAPTMDKSSFVIKRGNNAFLFHQRNNPAKIDATAVRWDILGGEMEEALNYRLASYEQIWINNSFAGSDGKISLTTSDKGIALLEKIKRALNDGNVVVTGGFSSAWQYTNRLSETGTLAKSKNESALIMSVGDKTGGHQLSIVGYDDEIAVKYNGVTLRGAFLVANSWGKDWMNNGYVWLMYDALNEVSEFEKLNVDKRVISMDQFCFTDWRKDVIIGAPKLYFEVEITAKNRESVKISPARAERPGKSPQTFAPYVFSYAKYHPKFDIPTGSYWTFDGVMDGEPCKATFAFDYRSLADVSSTKDFSKYQFGVSVIGTGEKITVHTMRLKNAEGEVLAEKSVEESFTGSKSFYFDEELSRLTVDKESADGLVLDFDERICKKGDKVSFTVSAAEGYTAEDLIVSVNGKEVPASGGKYEFTLSEDSVVSFSGVREAGEEPTEVSGETTAEPEPSVPAETGAQTSEQTPAEPAKDPVKNQNKTGLIIAIVLAASAVAVGCATVVCLAAAKKKKK